MLLSTAIEKYLDDIGENLRLDSSEKKEIIGELYTHIEEEVTELKSRGLHDEEAVSRCLRFLGSAKLVARQIYEAHSQGTWKQAMVASMPHLLFGLIFVLNIWRGIQWALVLIILISCVSVYGWWKSHSDCFFPWLGYSLLPVIAAGLSLIYLPSQLSWVAILLYSPLSIWYLFRFVKQTIRKDWIFVSLMLLPLPLISAWFIISGFTGNPQHIDNERLAYYGKFIGPGFLTLALGVMSFIRVRRRWLKIGVLFLAGMMSLLLIVIYAKGQLELITFLLLTLVLVSIFLIPAVLDNGVRTGKWGKIFNGHILDK